MPDSHNPLSRAPRALLLDFGGVVFQTMKRAAGRDDFAAALVARAATAGYEIERASMRASLDAGITALRYWKHASSRRLAPREMSHREIVGDFLAADLPVPVRSLLVAEAGDILEEMNRTLSEHEVRPGIRDLIAEAERRGIRLGIVSNAHSGQSHRRLLAEHGLAQAFGVQVYSDEVGMRKPHPRMINLAAAALGHRPRDAWYVGDTQDRDVVAGRRAGVGAVVLTASKHTEHPPFDIAETADAIFPTPEGLLRALRETALRETALRETVEPARSIGLVSSAAADRAPGAASARQPVPAALDARPRRAALLIDHGGVISTSQRDQTLLAEFCHHLAALLDAPDEQVSPQRAQELIEAARVQQRHYKVAQLHSPGGIRELDATRFWRDFVGEGLSTRARALLEAEAHDLMFRFGRAKSRRALRVGVRELLDAAHGEDMPVVVVSNTISGRAVRAECAAQGLDHRIAAYVCSDENGYRKPDGRIVQEALTIADADPALTWFLGDTPENDAAVALDAGIARRVLVRGGKSDDERIDAALASGLATDVIDDPGALVHLMNSTRDATRVPAP